MRNLFLPAKLAALRALVRAAAEETPEERRERWARHRAIGTEMDVLPHPCGGCKAGPWELCVSATGLAASAPCAERLAVSR